MANPFALLQSFTSLSAGHIVTDKEWNTSIGAIYSYINTSLLTNGLNSLTTSGDMYYFNGAALTRIPAGTDTQVLGNVAGVPTWTALVTAASLQNKGDLLGCSNSGTHALGALAIGADGTQLVADAASTLGFKWATSPASVPLGGIILWGGTLANIPANFVICDGRTITIGGFDGGNGAGVAFAVPNTQGVFIPGAGGGVNGPAAAGLGNLAIDHTGGSNTHAHSLVPIGVAAGASASCASSAGTSSANNVPVYVALPYIMRVS